MSIAESSSSILIVPSRVLFYLSNISLSKTTKTNKSHFSLLIVDSFFYKQAVFSYCQCGNELSCKTWSLESCFILISNFFQNRKQRCTELVSNRNRHTIYLDGMSELLGFICIFGLKDQHKKFGKCGYQMMETQNHGWRWWLMLSSLKIV